MEVEAIARLLKNAGFNVFGADSQFIYMEDPACILRSFATFAEYAWIIITFLTGILLFGWALSLIRGVKNDYFTNLRSLLLIFGVLSAAGPIINVVYGDDLFAKGCKTIEVSITQVQDMLDARDAKLSNQKKNQYEEFDISDTGAPLPPLEYDD